MMKKTFYFLYLIFLCFFPFSVIQGVEPNTVIAVISGFNAPQNLAVTPNGKSVYVPNVAGTNVSVIDSDPLSPTFNTILVTPGLASAFVNPSDVAITPDGNFAYVSNGPDTVSVIDTNPTSGTYNTVLNTPGLTGAFSGPGVMAVAPNGLYVYVANGFNDTIAVINIATNTVLTTINGLDHPSDIVMRPQGDYGYVSSALNSVTVIDINPLSVNFNTIIPAPGLIGTVGQAEGMGITPDGNFIYVTDDAGSDVNVIDSNPASPNFNTVLIVPALDGAFIGPADVAVTPNDAAAYVSNFSGNSVSVIDTDPSSPTYNTVIDTIDILPGSDPEALIVTPDGQYVYLSCPGTNTVTVIYIGAINAPQSFSGCKRTNIFLTQIDNYNHLTWKAPASGNAPVAYKIYRDSSLTQLIATVPTMSDLQYNDHNRNPDDIYTYYIVAIDDSGSVSAPATTTVTKYC